MKKTIQLSLVLSGLSFAYSQVGINTSHPKETLDIEGTLRVKTLGDYKSSAIPLSWDSATGKVLKGSTATQKPFYTIQYNIKPAVNSDQISNWDTNISSNQYTVVITSAYFRKDNGSGAPIALKDGGSLGPSVYPFINGGTWRLFSDFVGVDPVDKGQYEWVFNLLVINNNMIRLLSGMTGTISSGSTGSSSNPIP
nr:hypothetical protein [uncultured Chryseobacterium sp.]